MTVIDLHDWSKDLPRLPDPIADIPPASPDSPEAQLLLSRLQSSADPQPTRSRRKNMPLRRRTMAVLATAAVASAVLFFPFRGGPSPAEAIANASALLDATESGRYNISEIATREGRTETSLSTFEWSGDSLRITSSSTGSIWSADEAIFTPGQFEGIKVGNQAWMSVDGGPLFPSDFESSRNAGDHPLAKIADAAVTLDTCEAPTSDPSITSWCTTTTSHAVTSAILGWSPDTVSSADPVTIQVDLHTETGMVAAVRFEATNVIHRANEMTSSPDSPEQWTLDTLEIDRVYDSLGEPVTIEGP